MPEIVEYAKVGESRNRSIKIDGITVMINRHEEDDNAARALAEFLVTAPECLRQLQDENRKLRSLVPPKMPARLLGPGCVRMRDGAVWLLNQRAKGWAAWGFRLDGWDDLFRRYNVIVTSHGEDEHGAWWEVTNA